MFEETLSFDEALNLAVEKLNSQGMPEKEAYIALLVRLWSTVPEEVAEIATLPTLDEARAKIVGLLQAPQQKLLSILLAPGSKIANLAHAKSLKN